VPSAPARPRPRRRIFIDQQEDKQRPRQQMVDEAPARSWMDEKGRGYELSKGRYVEIDETN
jgi:hypothetical protein